MGNWATIILSGVVASILTLVITFFMQKKHDEKAYKMELFKNIIAYRTDISSGAISTGNLQKALNQVFVAYNKCPEVLRTFERLRQDVQFRNGEKDNDKIISDFLALVKAMADEMGINYSFSNDDLFTSPLILGAAPVITITGHAKSN